MRIAQVLTASTGGIGRHVASVAPRMVAAGHEVTIYCPEVTAQAQDFRGLPVRPLTALRRRGPVDVLHAHGYKAGGVALAAAVVQRAPVVVTWHNALLGQGPGAVAPKLLRLVVARGATLTLGASSDLVAEARRLGARAARLAPVAAPELPPPGTPREAVRAELGLGPAELLVLTVGRLAPQKNLGLALDVAARLRARGDLRFVVVGDGPLREALAARVAAEQLPVELVGRREDVASVLAAADLALLTSTWEARALVAQEALLAGVPLVSTAVGGVPELVGDAAVLVPAGDADAAAEAVRELADDPVRRAALRDAGRAQAATWPDEDDVAADLLAAYASLLAR